MAKIIVSIEGLKVFYYTSRGVIRAVDGASLVVPEGSWVSIVGESGSGKSTLGLAVMRLVPFPGRIVAGSILFDGIDITKVREEDMRKIRGRGIGMVFQDPMTSLDPLRRIGDVISEALIEHGMASSKSEAWRMAEDVLESVGLPRDRAYYYPHQLSGGQRQRALIASAIALKPRILIADEPTTALDVIVQAKIMDLIEDLKEEYKLTVILITHDIALASERSDYIAVMYAGRIVEYGGKDEVIREPLHPYTKALIESTPDVWGDKKLRYIPGYPPDLRDPPKGCRFHPRCPLAMKECSLVEPELLKAGGSERRVACLLYGGK